MALAFLGLKKLKPKPPHKPHVAKDTASSNTIFAGLYGLAEGEIAGLVDGGKSILLDDTPLINANGTPNFKNISWDFRVGTNDQSHIAGFPAVENEQSVGVELRHDKAWTKYINNTQLSAIRLRLNWNALRVQHENGDITGYKIEYAVDIQTDGGRFDEVLKTQIHDKTSQGYKRSHRIELPKANKGWTIRVRRLTANRDNEMVADTMTVDAITEIIDAKLRYPNTALLGLRYDAKIFSNIANIAVHLKGKIIAVPSNYNAQTRDYVGLWDGTFQQAYSDNPAWIFYDICTNRRYGLGERLSGMVDKWSLYQLAQYCDELVDDGKGGKEPRFTCNVYLQKQEDAYTVLQSLASIFRGMSYYNGEHIIVDADFPKDPVYTFSAANVIDGIFNYSGTRARDRHNIAQVAWDNPDNNYKTEYAFVRDEQAITRLGVRVLNINAFGCTSQGQAQRAGLWALKSEQLETRTVSFSTGLEGFVPQVGQVINIADNVFAGRAISGRIISISEDKRTLTLDREIVANAGDTLVINGSNGNEKQVIQSISGVNITVHTAFSDIAVDNIWAINSDDLRMMQFRILAISQNEATFDITALQYERQKYTAIDDGVISNISPISVLNPDPIASPNHVTITSHNRVVQTQTVTTLSISWEQVKGATAYIVEWRKDDGVWQSQTVSGQLLDVEGVYAGRYLARVRAVDAFGNESLATLSQLTAISGKHGRPPRPARLTVLGILFGMELSWGFANGSNDTNYTEIQVSPDGRSNIATLGQYAYPTNKTVINGLQGNLTQHYRARIVDKLGNVSDWTAWERGTTEASADKVLDLLNGQITESQLHRDLSTKVEKIEPLQINVSNINAQIPNINSQIADARRQLGTVVSNINTQIPTINNQIAEAKSRLTEAIAKIDLQKNRIDTANTQISSLQTAVSAVNNQLPRINSQIAAAQNQLNTAVANISTQTGRIDGAVRDIGLLKTQSATAQQDIATLKTQRGQLASSIEQVNTALTTAKETLTQQLNQQKSSVASNLAEINKVKQTVASNNQTQTTEINKLKSKVDADIASVNANINEYKQSQATKDQATAQRITAIDTAYKQADTELTTRLAREETARANGDNANAQNIRTLESTLNGLNGRVGTAESKISTLERTTSDTNQALATAQSQLNAKIDDIKIGGVNLLTQSIPTDFYAWGSDTGGSTVDIARKSWTVSDEKSRINRWRFIQNFIDKSRIKPDDNIVFSFDLMFLSEHTATIKLELSYPFVKNTVGLTINSIDYEKNKWYRIVLPTAIVADPTKNLLVSFALFNAQRGFELSLDNFQLELGNKATDYKQSELSLNNKIRKTEASLDEYKQAQATRDNATATKISQIETAYKQADTQTNARIAQETTARTSADNALSGRINNLQSEFDGNKSTVANQLQTISNTQNAQATSLQNLTATANSAKSTAEDGVRRANSADAKATQAKTDIATEQRARADADSALSNRITALDSAYKQADNALRASITTAQQTATNAQQAVATAQSQLNARIDNKVDSSTLANYYTKAETDSATAGKIEQFSNELNIGGENLISLEQSSFNSAGATHQQINANDEHYRIQLNHRGFPFNSEFVLPSGLELDGHYVFSCEIRGSSQGVVHKLFLRNNTNQFAYSISDFNVTMEWQKINITKNIVATINGIGLRLIGGWESNDWIEIRYIQLQRGTKATAYHKATATLRNSINANAQAITATNNTVSNIDGRVTSQASQITALDTAYKQADNTIKASVQTEAQARTNADNALSQRIDSLTADYNGNKSSIASQLKTLSDKDKATASQISQITANVTTAQNTANTANTNAQNAKRVADDALGKANTANSAITTEQRARADGDSSLASRIATLDSAYKQADSNLTSRIAREETARASGDNANAQAVRNLESTVNGINGRVGTAESKIGTLERTTANTNQALATAQSQLNARINGKADSSTLTNYYTKAETDSATAQQIQNLQSNFRLQLDQKQEALKTTELDLRELDENKYYPIAFSGLAVNEARFIRVSRSLGQYGEKPSWATHTAGFTLICEWEANASGWGAIVVSRNISNFEWRYSRDNKSHLINIGQLGNASVEFCFLRGGARYKAETHNKITARVLTEATNFSGQSIAPMDYNANLVPQSTKQAINAQITTERTTRTNADNALSQRIDSLTSEFNGNKSSVASQIKSLTDAKNSQATQITGLQASVTTAQSTANTATTKADDGIRRANNAQSTANTAVSKADTAKARADEAHTKATTNTASIATEQRARADADSALSNRITALDSAYKQADNALRASITTAQQTATNAQQAVATAQNQLNARFDNLAIGGRNLLLNSKEQKIVGANHQNQSASDTWVIPLVKQPISELIKTLPNTDCVLSFDWEVLPANNQVRGRFLPELNAAPYGLFGWERQITVSNTNKSGRFVATSHLRNFANSSATHLKFRLDDFVGTLIIKNAKLETGTMRTDWTPAPEEDSTWTVISSQMDLNTMTTQGKYFIRAANNPNAPIANWLFVQVNTGFSDRIMQTVWQDNNVKNQWVRHQLSGHWGAWEKLTTAGELAQTNAVINEFKQAQTTKNQAVTQKLSQLESGLNNKANASALNNLQTKVNQVEGRVNAEAQKTTTLQTTVGRHTASIQQHSQSINGLNAQYTLKIDAGGRISGYGLASNNGVSDFAINVDKFRIAPPTGNGKGEAPFMVLTKPTNINGTTVPSGTYIKSAYIHNGSIDIAKINKASISSLSALTANIGHFKSAERGARLEIKDGVLLVYDNNNRLRVRLGVW